ncbi:MAG: TetR/AcrR family transcriptional regulator [Ilumatobacteraceae bacterium]
MTATTAGTGNPTPYHHGDLPNALRAAAVDVIADKGLGAFSLREVARRAGVSHAAPGYHFGDVRGLLTSLAVEGFETLHRELVDAGAGIDDPVERLKAIGRGYVRVAIRHPAHCEVIFRDDVIDANDARVERAGQMAYGVLESTVAEIVGSRQPAIATTDATRLCWSAMQGLVQLRDKFSHMDEALGDDSPTIEDQADRFTALLLAGLLAPRQVVRARR